MFRTIRRELLGASTGAGLAVWLLVAGCSGERGGPEAPPEGGGKAAAAPSAASLEILAKADAADGKTDKTLEKCVTCSLAMAGSADHESQLGEYHVHLCSADCKNAFEADPASALEKLKLP